MSWSTGALLAPWDHRSYYALTMNKHCPDLVNINFTEQFWSTMHSIGNYLTFNKECPRNPISHKVY